MSEFLPWLYAGKPGTGDTNRGENMVECTMQNKQREGSHSTLPKRVMGSCTYSTLLRKVQSSQQLLVKRTAPLTCFNLLTLSNPWQWIHYD